MKRLLFIFAAMALTVSAIAQTPADRSEVRSGNRDFRKKNFKEAEIDYRRALVKDSTSVAGNFNLANTLYRMEEYSDAAKYMETAENACQNDADIFYNKGNIALAEKNFNTAVDAFKQALLLRPDDVDAKENYIYAKKMLEDQQQQQQNQNNDQNQDQNRDNNQDNKQNQDQDNNQNQNKDQQNQDQNQDQDQDRDQQNSQQQPSGLTPSAAQQMLQAIEAKEKDTQEKVKKEQALRAQSRKKDKNW